MPITVLELNAKDSKAVYMWAKLNALDEAISKRIEPLMILRDIGLESIRQTVFDGRAEDATHEIKLDDNHSIVFTMKDGKFEYDTTCNCEHQDHETAPEGDKDIVSMLSKAMLGMKN